MDMKTKLVLLLSVLSLQFCTAQNSQTIKNLQAFTRAYGYVKYFHPSDEAFAVDWNKFSAYGAAEVEKCKNNEELVEALNKVFLPIAPTIKFGLSDNKTPYKAEQITPENIKDYKQVYWQHQGVGFNTLYANKKSNPYQSVRVNKKAEVDKSAEFGNLMTWIKPKDLRGKEFKYEGWARLEDGSEGQGQPWIRVDLGKRKVGFFNNSRNNPITDSKWTKFEIEGRVDSTAQGIVIGCFLLGKGTLYVDNIKLSYKEDNAWIEFPVTNKDFETEGLKTNGKSDAKWRGLGDGYAIKIQSKDKQSGSKAVKIQYEGETSVNKGEQLFDCKPEVGEIIEEEITDGVYCQIPLLVFGNKTETYPPADKQSLEKLSSQVSKIKESPDDLYVRIGNIVNTYNLFKHFYPYFDVVDVNWEAELLSALKQSYADKNGEDHQNTLLRFTAKLRDGHVNVGSKYNYNHIPPILWEWVEGKLIITHVKDKSLPFKRGDVVESIDGKAPSDYFANTHSLISAANEGWLNYKAINKSLAGKKGSTITIGLNSREHVLTRAYSKDEVLKSGDVKTDKYRFYNDSSIVYLNLDIIEMDTINELMSALEKSSAIICDLRGYPNSNHALISHLLKDDDTSDAWMQVPQIIYPDYKNVCSYEKHGWFIKTQKPYLGDKQVIFIIDGQAISYAESYLGFIEGYDLATIVGQPSAGTNGNVNPFEINGAYRISWTGMKVLKHDGSQHHGIGIIPDVRVEKTIEGVRDGIDEFLEKALELAE